MPKFVSGTEQLKPFEMQPGQEVTGWIELDWGDASKDWSVTTWALSGKVEITLTDMPDRPSDSFPYTKKVESESGSEEVLDNEGSEEVLDNEDFWKGFKKGFNMGYDIAKEDAAEGGEEFEYTD